jgi:hypothetical protein
VAPVNAEVLVTALEERDTLLWQVEKDEKNKARKQAQAEKQANDVKKTAKQANDVEKKAEKQAKDFKKTAKQAKNEHTEPGPRTPQQAAR